MSAMLSHSPSDAKSVWHHFADRFGYQNLLPIAQGDKDSDSTLPRSVIGKVPSVFTVGGSIVGYRRWPSQRATKEAVELWASSDRIGMGLLLGHPLPQKENAVAVCIDVDLNSEEQQELVFKCICEALKVPTLPMRVRNNSPRRAYILSVVPPEDAAITKRVLKLGKGAEGKPEAVEFLARGQQVAVYGRHPSGAFIEWLNGPASGPASEAMLPEPASYVLTFEEYEALIAAIAAVLPVASTATQSERRARMANDAANAADFDDPIGKYLDDNGYTIRIGKDGERHIRSPFASEYQSEQGGPNDTSVTYFLPGTCGYEQGHFVSQHSSDEGRTDADFLDAIGYVSAQFDVVTEEEVESGRTYNGIAGNGLLLDPKGQLGDKFVDKQRAMISALLNIPLALVPPRIHLKKNSKGEVVGYRAQSHSENLRWAIEKRRWTLRHNAMAWEIEFLDSEGNPIADSEAKTLSMLADIISEDELPDNLVKLHFDALSRQNSYHPVRDLLDGRKWDGFHRVDNVFALMNAERPEYAAKVMRLACVAAIASLYKGSVKMKAIPVIYSAANDWFKSAFVRRLFDILPGAFAGGVSVDPKNKDSVRKAVFAWGVELGELDSMTKGESAMLKAWIEQPLDSWRQEYSATFTKKPRQTTFVGTVNHDDFCKDVSLQSRFPVIALNGPIHIDAINKILGWELAGNEPQLVHPDNLIQFWLEIREEFEAGASYTPSDELSVEMKRVSDKFTDKGSYYATLRDVIDSADGDSSSWPYRRAKEIVEQIGLNACYNRVVGKALAQLVREGHLRSKATNGGTKYTFPDPVADLSFVSAEERIAESEKE